MSSAKNDFISGIIKSALDEAKGDQKRAVALLEQWARSNRRIYQALTMNYLHRTCVDAIQSEIRDRRVEIWKAPREKVAVTVANGFTKPAANRPSKGAGLHLIAKHNLMNMPVPFLGIPLGSATREQLDLSIAKSSAQAKTMSDQAAFLRQVRERIGNNRTVSQSMTEADLVAMKERINA